MVDKSTVQRELRAILPILFTCVKGAIQWPLEMPVPSFFNCVRAIDCTPHFQKRVHSGSLEYYRGDYKDYFFTVQIVVRLEGKLWSVHIGLGHNNDMNMYQRSRVGQLLAGENVSLLADRGYISQLNLVSPLVTCQTK